MTQSIARSTRSIRVLSSLATFVLPLLLANGASAQSPALSLRFVEPTPDVAFESGSLDSVSFDRAEDERDSVEYESFYAAGEQFSQVTRIAPAAFQAETATETTSTALGAREVYVPYSGPGAPSPNVVWSAMCPEVYGWAEGVIMFRDNQSNHQVLVQNANTNAALISTGDLEFSAAGGVRAGIGLALHDRWSLEFQFLGGLNHVAQANVSGTNELALPGDLGLAVNNFFLADEADVRYESQLNSPELNLVVCRSSCDDEVCDSCEWFVGFRYLELNEELGIRSFDADESTSRYRVHTYNNLYGGQLGVRGRRSRGRWSLEAMGKAGVFANQAQQVQDPIYDFPGIQFRSRRSAVDSDTAFVGEANLTGVFHINSVWGLRAGYNVMWIEGVALAPDQLDFTNTAASGTGITSNGGVFLHGASAGLEARY